jgi:shikimate dehydrogenase
LRQFGLIGKSLEYSFSKEYFTKKFLENKIDAQYENIELPSSTYLCDFLNKTEGIGFNVTIPYKETIVPLISILDKNAQQIGAINCIKLQNGEWVGTNTDAKAFEESLQQALKAHHTHALVLGTGGASKAVVFALKNLNISFINVSRSMQPGSISYIDLDAHIIAKYSIIINCTPLGTWPNINSSPPIPYHLITDKHLCFDLVYQPSITLFMQHAIAQGATVINGYDMLIRQAEASWHFWNEE